MKINGACHCGAIAFEAEIDPTRVVVCHCNDCQVMSGAPLRAVVSTPIEKLSLLRGSPKSYVKVAQSGRRRSQVFCPDCGTALWGTASESPTAVNIRLGCIEQRAQLSPGFQVWQSCEAPWLQGLRDVPGLPQQ
jgi:hypothetical protein